MFRLLILITLLDFTLGYQDNIRIGILLRPGDDIEETIIDNVLRKSLSNGPFAIPYQLVKERVLENDAIHYHGPVCRLLNKGVGVVLAPADASYFPILASYSNEYNISVVNPELLETPDDPKAPDLQTKFAVSIPPSTTRAMLDLIRDFRWQEIVYVYDGDYGPEKLQIMFRIGYTTLNLKLVGFAKVSTAKEANSFLRNLSGSGRRKSFNVLLDTDIELAHEILMLNVHQMGIREKNHNFIIARPTLENFWSSTEFRALRVTGFLAIPRRSNGYSVKEEWMKLLGHPGPDDETALSISHYYYHDSTLFLSQAVRGLWHRNINYRPTYNANNKIPDALGCFQEAPDTRMAPIIRKINLIDTTLTGKMQFSETTGNRININLTIVQTSHDGLQEFGSWSDDGKMGGLRKSGTSGRNIGGALPQIANKPPIRITTILSPPFMMLKKTENESPLVGNDRFEGYCKDIIDNICEILQLEYQLNLADDGLYGRYDPVKERWSGMIGEIIQVKADMGVADLIITGKRQRVVDFTDPFDTVSFSLVMKNPDSIRTTSSMFFLFNAFTYDVWICMLLSAVLFSVIFHTITKFTGAPDSIDSASGIWGRKNVVSMNVWFSIGSSMMQATGVYPRSISSRILSGAWWFSTTIFACLFIASITSQLQSNRAGDTSPQLLQLKSLSLESILRESLQNGWPKVGIIYPSAAAQFIQNSNLPLYKQYAEFLKVNPDLKIPIVEEGIKRVRESDGSFILMMASTPSDYAVRQKPCDIIAIHDSYSYAGYGIALSPLLDPALRSKMNVALAMIQRSGLLGHLHRKWWIESSQCKKGFVSSADHGLLHSFSGFFCVLLAGVILLLIVFGIQYSRKIDDKERRRQQLTFDDMNLDHQLPTPPPELLAEPPPVLNVPEIERMTLTGRGNSENFKDFFDRMRGSM